MTAVCFDARRATAIPDMPGIRRSTMDTCGFCSSIAFRASSPSRACATTSKPCEASTREIESRTAGWSSASMQVMRSISVIRSESGTAVTVVIEGPPWGGEASSGRSRDHPIVTIEDAPHGLDELVRRERLLQEVGAGRDDVDVVGALD